MNFTALTEKGGKQLGSYIVVFVAGVYVGYLFCALLSNQE